MNRVHLTLLCILLASTIIGQQANIVVQKGHSSAITQAVISKDSKYIVSSSSDKLVKLWDITTGKEMRTFAGHTSSVNSVAITPDGKKIVSGGDDRMVRIWDVETGKELRKLQLSGDGINQVLVSPDGKYFVALSRNIQIWDLELGFMIREMEFPSGFSSGSPVDISTDGKFLLGIPYSYFSSIAPFWDFKTGKLLTSFPKIPYSSNDVISSNENAFSISTKEGMVCIKEFANGVEALFNNCQVGKFFSNSRQLSVQWDTNANYFSLLNSANGFVQPYLPKSSIFTGGELSSNSNYLLTLSKENTLLVWDLTICKPIQSFNEGPSKDAIIAFDLSADNNFGIYATSKGKIVAFSLDAGKILAQHTGTETATSVSISPNGKAIALGTKSNKSLLFSLDKSTISPTKSFEVEGEVTKVTYSNSGSYIGVSTKEKLHVFDATSLKSIYSDKIYACTDICFSPKDEYLAAAGKGMVSIFDIEEKELYLTLLTDKGIDVNNYTLLQQSGRVGAWDKEIESTATSVRFSSDGKQIITSNDDFTVQVWDWHRGKRSAIYRNHSQEAVFAAFSNYSNSIISVSSDMTIQLHDPTSKFTISMMAHTNSRDWIAFSTEGYWDASQYGGDLIAFVQGRSCWNIDQFAVTTNRPDLLLAKNPLTDRFTIKHLHAQYLKRLRKFGLTEQTASADTHTPQSDILKVNATGNSASVSFKLSDSTFNVVSYNIFVNNVPIHSGKGKTIPPSKAIQLTENITLLNGENRVEVTCYNSNGVESIRALTALSVKDETRPHLYYLGFGVSEYKNSDYNLRYAAKDIKDMAEVVKGFEGKRFEKTHIKTYLNSEVTAENIQKSKEFLKNAKPHDVFILHIAGHGMHERNSNAEYYFLTHTSDTAKLAQTAAKFETIEAILDGIAPRKKLFLMDACESGEKDDDEAFATGGFQQITGLNYRGFINVGKTTQSQSTMKSFFQKDRFIYNDLTRRTGAIVFSSSKGGEPSAERSDHENGLFTEYIMQAFTNNAADSNGDGKIGLDELRDFVYRNVVTDTNNRQHPTIDRDNIYQRIEF